MLSANGTPLLRGGNLKVCALRCAGIYGEGEQRHLPRIVVFTRLCACIYVSTKDIIINFNSPILREVSFVSLMVIEIIWLITYMLIIL